MPIDGTIPNTTERPIDGMRENFRQIGAKIDGHPETNDPVDGDQTPPYDGLPLVVTQGKQTRPGGNLNLRGFSVYGGTPVERRVADLPTNHLIRPEKYEKFRDTIFFHDAATETTITFDDKVTIGTAVSGTSVAVVLDNTASSADNIYDYMILKITAGTGNGQSGIIKSYNGSDKKAVFYEPLEIAPDNTSEYEISAPLPFLMNVINKGPGNLRFLADGGLTALSGAPTRFPQNSAGSVVISTTGDLMVLGASIA